MSLFIPLVVDKILASSKLRGMDKEYTTKLVMKEIQTVSSLRQLAQEARVDQRVLRRKEVQAFIRHVRSLLFAVHGRFQSPHSDERDALLVRMHRSSTSDFTALCHKLLLFHASSRERLSDYSLFYEKLFSVTGIPRRVLDLGCGMNPVSFPYTSTRHVTYTAVELSQQDCSFLERFFLEAQRHHPRLTYRVLSLDLAERSVCHDLAKLGEYDLCLLLKMSDVVERKKGHAQFEAILRSVRASWIAVSFPTKTLSQKHMKVSQRRWFQLLTRRLGFDVSSFQTSNELVYILHRTL